MANTTSIDSVFRELQALRRDVDIIKEAVLGQEELTPWAKRALRRAREEDESQYVDLEDI